MSTPVIKSILIVFWHLHYGAAVAAEPGTVIFVIALGGLGFGLRRLLVKWKSIPVPTLNPQLQHPKP